MLAIIMFVYTVIGGIWTAVWFKVGGWAFIRNAFPDAITEENYVGLCILTMISETVLWPIALLTVVYLILSSHK